jgi:hypothetical protein
MTASYESDYTVPPVSDRNEFWRFAHDLTVRHNGAKGNKDPLKTLRHRKPIAPGNVKVQGGREDSNVLAVLVKKVHKY